MNLSTILLTCVLVCFANSTAISQGNWIKLYAGISYTSNYDQQNFITGTATQPSIVYEPNAFPILALAFAHETANGQFWEVSFRGRTAKNQSSGYIQTPGMPGGSFMIFGDAYISLFNAQIEWSKLFQVPATAFVIPSWGIFLQAKNQTYEFKPASGTAFFQDKYSQRNANLGVVTRLMTNPQKRVSLDFNFCVALLGIGLESRYFNHPAFTEEQKKSFIFHSDILPETQVRFGLVYRIGK